MKEPAFLPYLAITTTAVIFGFSFLFTKNTLDHAGIFQVIGYRFLAAALFLLLLRVLRLVRIPLRRENLRRLLPIALVQPVMYFTFETIGVGMTTSAMAGVIISMAPLAILFSSAWILREPLTWVQWAAAAVSGTGVILVALSGSGAAGPLRPAGLAALLLAVVAAGLFNPLSRRVSAVSTPLETTWVMMWTGAVVFNTAGLAGALARGEAARYFSPLGEPAVLANIGFLAVLSSVLAFFLFNYALSRLPSSRTGMFLNLVPLISIWAGAVFRQESFQPAQYAGVVLILAGIWAGTAGRAGRRKAPPPDAGVKRKDLL